MLTLCNDDDVSESGFLESDNAEAWGRVARAVQLRRVELDWSQRRLANKAGVGETFVVLLETAQQKRIRKSNSWKLERALGWETSSIQRLLIAGIDPIPRDSDESSGLAIEVEELREAVTRQERQIEKLQDTVDSLLKCFSNLPKPKRRD